MSQALYTSMSGINAATTQISVVSNNVANINTTAFKSADARFENLFSKTYTTGTSPTKTAGGINPKQIGMGVEVGSIVRNFTEGTYVATGRSEDLMISGGGYFTVMNSSGEIFYTRDGSFTLDAEGNMVTQSGMYVLGAAQIYNTSASQTKINIPQTVKITTAGNNKLNAATIKDLNDSSITAGDFYVKFSNDQFTQTVKFEITSDDLEGNVEQLINKFNALLNSTTDANGDPLSDHIVANYTSEGTITFSTKPQYQTTIAKKSDVTVDLKSVECYSFQGPDGNTYYWSGVKGSPIYSDLNGTVAFNGNEYISQPAAGSGVEYEIKCNGWADFVTNDTEDVDTWPQLDFAAGTSNFLEATRLASAEQDEADGSYTSKILDYTVSVEPIAALSEAVNLESYSVGTDGTIEAAYSNGDKLTVEANQNDNTFEWKYTTSNGVVIRGADKINVNENLADTSGFVLQLATVTNEAGLVSKNNNLWSIGPNTGDTVYAVGGSMGLGEIQTGGLEGSNVDLSRELSNMILAQRAIQANSRVFSTASSIMETLSYLGS